MDFFEHVNINTPSLFEFLTLFQDTARFFVLGSQENSVSEKKPLLTADLNHKLPMHIQRKKLQILRTVTLQHLICMKSTIWASSNLTSLVLICPTQSSTLKAPSLWISQLLSV
jgi:hypothetical protein